MKKHNLLIFLILISLVTNAQSRKNTLGEAIHKHQNLDRIDSIAKKLNYKGGDKIRILTMFRVTKDGYITDIKARGPHKAFEEEAIKVLKLVPKLDPPKLNGKPASPKFSLPIIFVVETDKQKKRRQKRELKKLKNKL